MLNDNNNNNDNDDYRALSESDSEGVETVETEKEEQLVNVENVNVPKQTVVAKKSKKSSTPKYTWTNYAIEALIIEWEVSPILFDCTHADYHIKEKRRIAVERVRDKMVLQHKVEPAPSQEDIVKKMNNLRTYSLPFFNFSMQ